MSINQHFIIGIVLLASGSSQAQHGDTISVNKNVNHHCLFEENSFTIGLGATYSFQLEGMGVNSRLYYNVGEHVCFGSEFSYLKKGEESIYDISLIGHYIFETKLVGIYPVLGANYTKESDEHESEEAFGAVFGGGIHRNFGKLTAFTEYTHIESTLRDDFVTLGLMINLK